MNAGHRFNRKITGSRPLFNTHTYFDASFFQMKWKTHSMHWKLLLVLLVLVLVFFLSLYNLEREGVKEIDAKIPIHDSHLTTSTIHQSKETKKKQQQQSKLIIF